jgi:nucleoside-diphosphate-sugar epimerase
MERSGITVRSADRRASAWGRAREELGWIPQYDYKRMLASLIEECDENETQQQEKGGV